MNKTEFKKVAKALINNRFDFYDKVRIVEMCIGKSDIDKKWFANYLVIVNNYTVKRVYVSESEDNDVFYKESKMEEQGGHKGFYNIDTLKQTY